MTEKVIPDDLKEWIKEKWGTDKLPAGGVVPFHSSYGYRTGDWSAMKPFISKDTCIGCLNCFFYCPDSAIEMDENGKSGVDFNYCKGCGICEKHCPVDAIQMETLKWIRDQDDIKVIKGDRTFS